MLYSKNAQIIEQTIVSIEDRAFLYGDGCFTTMRLKHGQIVLWERHLLRIKQAISALRLNCDINCIKNNKDFMLSKIDPDASGILKIVISRGTGQRGYAFGAQKSDIYCFFYPEQTQNSSTDHVSASKIALFPQYTEQVGILAEPLASQMPCLKGIKTLNRLEQVILKSLATEQGFNDALCFDQQAHLVEGISSNCFILLGDTWLTPDLALAGIAGVMRAEILARMKNYQIAHQVRMISQDEIGQIRAGFFCNALSPMSIMRHISITHQQHHLDAAVCEHLFSQLHLDELI